MIKTGVVGKNEDAEISFKNGLRFMSPHLVKVTGQVLVADNVCVFMEPYNESVHGIGPSRRHQYRPLHEHWAFVESPKAHLPCGAIIYDIV